MAIPQVLRETDYSTVDFTDVTLGILEVLKDALTVQLGWNLEFEDLVSADKSFVVSNNGTGNYLKFTKESSDDTYLKIEVAQSWSDLTTPVNLYRSFYADCRQIADDFVIVGTNKAFYLYMTSSKVVNGTTNKIVSGYFFGDIKTSVDNDPLAFIATPNYASTDLEITNKYSAGSSNPPVLIDLIRINDAFSYNMSSAYVKGTDLKNYTLVCPGVIPIQPSVATVDFYNMPASNPIILSEIYLSEPSAFSNNEIIKIIGRLPGLAYNATLNNLVWTTDNFTEITIAGENCITIPDKDYWSNGVIRLTDWDLI